MERLLSLAIGYLCGSFLTADAVCMHAIGKPAREVGSGNPGMTNVWRNVGKKEGGIVLVGDIAKAAVAMGVSWLLFRRRVGKIAMQYAGLGSVLGHDFSFMAHGHGGNGVAVTGTWLVLGLGWWGLLAGMVAGSFVFTTGLMPLTAVMLGIISTITAFLVADVETGVLFAISCIIIIWRHREGMGRVFRGEQEHVLKLTEVYAKYKAKKTAEEGARRDE